MKTTKLTFLFSLLIFAFFTSTFAQVETKKGINKASGSDIKTSQRNSTNGIDETEAVNNKIIIRNQSDTEILNITEETNSAASIYFYDKSDFFAPGKKLVNDGGNLYWGNDQLGVAGSAGGWTDAGSQIYNSTLTDRVGIGTNNPLSKLSIGGSGSALYSIFSSNSASSGVGIYGSGSGPFGKGVYGYSSAADGRGIVGQTTGYRGRAVYGVASSSSQFERNYAGYFEATGEYATAVYGEAIGPHGIGIVGIASSPQSFAAEFLNFGDNSTTVNIENSAPIGTALRAVGTTAALFGGEVQIVGALKTDGEVTVGSSGTPFLEIREITGTTGTNEYGTEFPNALPAGWVGDQTRILSLEIKSDGIWHTLGYFKNSGCGTLGLQDGEISIGAKMYENSRKLTIYYPRCNNQFENAIWRAIIMRMPQKSF